MKYRIEKTMEVAGSHQLDLPYESKCRNRHGHNWIITVICEADSLVHGMVVDFGDIKETVMALDHLHLNDLEPFLDSNPTAENIAAWILGQIDFCVEVRVLESKGNLCIVTR